MNVGSLCSRRVASVPESASLRDVARLMRSEQVGAVVVVRGATGAQVVGIITDRDIVRTQLQRAADLASIGAGEAMTPDPLCFEEQEPIDGAIAHLRARGVRRAPVLAANGTLVGLISTDDLLVHLATTLIGSAGIVARQVRHERERAAGTPTARSGA